MAPLAIFKVNVGAEAGVLRHGYQREERAAKRKEQATTIRTEFFIHRARPQSPRTLFRFRTLVARKGTCGICMWQTPVTVCATLPYELFDCPQQAAIVDRFFKE
jgi:hypothetical protein